MKVYVVQKLHSDCDCENFGIFSTEEKAKSFTASTRMILESFWLNK